MSLLALGAASAPAHRVMDPITNPSHTVTCTFGGLAGRTTPSNPNDNGIEAVAEDIREGDEGSPDPELFPPGTVPAAAEVLLDTDTGVYTFDGPATCVDTSLAVNPIPVQIHWEGAYRNTICGTGIADGQATTAMTIKNPAGTVTYFDTIHHRIVLVAGQGELTIYHSTDQAVPGAGGILSGGGFVQIDSTPDDPTTPENENGGNCATTDVSSFFVMGSFTMIE